MYDNTKTATAPPTPTTIINVIDTNQENPHVANPITSNIPTRHHRPKTADDPPKSADTALNSMPLPGLDTDPHPNLLTYPDFKAADALESAELSYHHPEIANAVAALPPAHRAYVMHYFWGAASHKRIAGQLGVAEDALTRVWEEDIRPQLISTLAHLADAL